MNEILVIDPEAKTTIPLIKVPKDAAGNPYFIGKMQFPGTMDFERGASFMVFTAEDGHEELQIAPLDPMMLSKVNANVRGASINNGKFSIDLVRFIDQNGADYYVGEALGLSKIIFSTASSSQSLPQLEGKRRFRCQDFKSNIARDMITYHAAGQTLSIQSITANGNKVEKVDVTSWRLNLQ